MKRTFLTLTPVWLEGLLSLANAIPDLALVVDCVNCGDDRFATVGDLQDYVSALPSWNRSRRTVYSELEANDMVLGTEDKVRNRVAEVVAQRKPPAVLLVQSTAVRLIGTDLEALAEDLQQEHGLPMIPVPSPPTEGDWTDGYDQGLAAIARHLPFEPHDPQPDEIALVGHHLSRHEEDDLGNVRELRRLQRGLGLAPRALWLDGSPFSELGGVFRARKLVTLAGGSRAAEAVARRSGAEVVPAELPVGLDGTVRWLQSVAEAFGCAERARGLVDRELDRAVPRLDKVVRRSLMHRRVGIVGTPDLCIALGRYAIELGMSPSLCAVLTLRHKQGERVRRALADAGCTPTMAIDPEYHSVEKTLQELHGKGELDLVVGAGSLRDAAKSTGVPYLELGHPSLVRHALHDAPWWGFEGALWLAGAMFNLIHEHEYRSFA